MKYWGLIVVSRPHIFSLGDHEDTDAAMACAQEFCDKKNEEKNREADEKEIPENKRQPLHDLLWILDENDMRNLTGEVHRPYHLPKPKREAVSAEAPVRHGRATQRLANAAENPAEAAAPAAEAEHTCQEGGAPCRQCRCERAAEAGEDEQNQAGDHPQA